MFDSEYREYLRRADAAASIADLRKLRDEVRSQHPGDAEAELIVDTCQMYAQGIVNKIGQEREQRAARRSVNHSSGRSAEARA